MIQVYRLRELSRRYPSFVYVAHCDGRWHAEIKNPFSRDWWREWRSPRWAGMR
jgi:hypothetical protein